ncbi:DoxX family membrane protein [Corynebacterium poyangense]|uniref:DoxX family membrane protein n=1 Tax=Corynebacterium poyangense TaxID=2684405 RepID=A0A7H0SNM4_9CORY|nr:DoxX family protein [Corynebacterium poyangense]MBZ8177183.1 DoxX family membrane protein [Corynebacterium poyangense]QNQ90149.1 DoxX family membrane protein [Corynebacterium poyangense]
MIRKLARPMLASVYVVDGVDTLANVDAHVEGTEQILKRVRSLLPRKYAKQIPDDPKLVTRAVGGAKVGAASALALGKAPRLAAGTLTALTIPTILARHAFWETQDEEEKKSRRQGFLTNLALLGGLAITTMDTEGRPGLRWRANKAVQAALPTKSEAEKFQANAKEFFSDASSKAGEYATTARDYVDDNKDDWIDSVKAGAASLSEKVQDLTESARGYIDDNKDDWLDSAKKNSAAARKSVVKTASKAQERADAAFSVAQDKADKKLNSRSAKKAQKKAKKLQKQADKSLKKAKKKLAGKFDF